MDPNKILMNKLIITGQLILYIMSTIVTTIFGRRSDLWIFANHSGGNEFSDNSKYMYLHIHNTKDNIYPIWITRNQKIKDSLDSRGLQSEMLYTLRSFYYTLRAEKVFISGTLKSMNWAATGGAEIVQLRHGVPLKQLDNKPNPSSILSRYLIRTIESYDYICTNSKQDEVHLKRSVSQANNVHVDRLMSGEYIRTGFPRNDRLVEDIPHSDIGVEENIKEITECEKDIHNVFVYLPTFREYENDNPFNMDVLNSKLNELDSILLVKPHRFMQDKYDTNHSNIVVVPSHMDIYPIIEEADCLITDYSSIYFDYILTDNPVIFYHYDIKKYRENRGLHDDFDEIVTGPVAESFEDLLFSMEHILDVDGPLEEQSHIKRKYMHCNNGRSSQKVFERITTD